MTSRFALVGVDGYFREDGVIGCTESVNQLCADIVLAGEVEGLGDERISQGFDDFFCGVAQFEIVTEGILFGVGSKFGQFIYD